MEVPKPCIYRVPKKIRDVNSEAYTPRMVLIGPLHRSLKMSVNIAKEGAETSSNPWYINIAKEGAETSSDPWDLKKEYLEMEDRKKQYLESYTRRVGKNTIVEMWKTIQEEEKNIRASYKESTELITSEDFVDLILQDSVFIMEFITLHCENSKDDQDQASNASVVRNDLILLENQLPYFIFRRLFSSLDRFILRFFEIDIEDIERDFKHFTDMLRCAYEESLIQRHSSISQTCIRWPEILHLKSADKLSQAGVKFKSIENLKLRVEFEKDVLTMPTFNANETSDIFLRNVIAFEQCHLAVVPFTSNYIRFLNFLITSEKDVQILMDEEVVRNPRGQPSYVLDMVNKLQLGVDVGTGSQYYYVEKKIRAYYKSRRKRSWATLKNVYFSDLWKGTATLAAVFLLLLTLIGTVASVIQAYKSF